MIRKSAIPGPSRQNAKYGGIKVLQVRDELPHVYPTLLLLLLVQEP
jgi:hypothetical protein